jgi:hypothetical protein
LFGITSFSIYHLVISHKEVEVAGSLTSLEVLEGIMGSTRKPFQITVAAVQR